MIFFVIRSLSILVLLGLFSNVYADLLTLDQALKLALQENRLLENANLEVTKAIHSVDAERTKRYPKLQFNFSESYNFSPQSYTYQAGTFGVVPTEEVNIVAQQGFTTILTAGVKQPLTQLYRIGLSIEQLEIKEAISAEQLRARRQDIIKRVNDAYYAILKTQYSLQANQKRTAFLQELYKTVRQYYQQQTVLQYQTLEVQAKLARAKHDMRRDNNILETEREKLNILLGRDLKTPFTVSAINDAQIPVPELSDIEVTSLLQRPEVRETQLKLQHAEYAYQIKQAEYIPDIDLEVRYTKLFGTEFIPDQESVVALRLQWEIYDWGKKSQELGSKRFAIQQSRNRVQETEARIVLEVNQRYRQLYDALDLQQVSELAQTAAQEKLRVLMNQYQQQAVLLDDVLRAEANLTDADTQYHHALLAAWSARAALDKAMGVE